MTPPNNLFDKLKQMAFNRYSKGLGSMLIVTSALGWVLGSAGQIFGVITNKKYSNEDKEFLIKQEIADGILNIVAFCLITMSFKNLSKKAVDTGKVITPKIAEFCKKLGIDLTKEDINIPNKLNEKINEITNKIESIRKSTDKSQLTKLESDKKVLLDFKENTIEPFQSGAEVFGTLAGGILASNIVTPILRNKIAAYWVKNKNNKPQQPTQSMYNNGYKTQSGLKI